MALNGMELAILSSYLIGHPYISRNDLSNTEVLTYVTSSPDMTTTTYNALSVLPDVEISNFFAIRDVSLWFSDLYSKFNLDTDVPVSFLGADDDERKRAVRLLGINLLEEIVDMGLIDRTMQQLYFDLLKRLPEGIKDLITLLIAQGNLAEVSGIRLRVELFPTARWVSMFLSEAPTQADIDGILV